MEPSGGWGLSRRPMIVRPRAREELPRIWEIDRRETIDGLYRLDEEGTLIPVPYHFEVPGWPPDAEPTYAPILATLYEAGGQFVSAWEGDTIAGVAVVDLQPVASIPDLRQLVMLHVGREYRGRGLGADLFRRAQAIARDAGAAGLYISATPSRRTIDFYCRFGARPLARPDPTLLALEPADIHLGCSIRSE